MTKENLLKDQLETKNQELNNQIKRNEVIQKLLKNKEEDQKNLEASYNTKSSKLKEVVEKKQFSCDICVFSAKNKAGLKQHMKVNIM